MATTPQSEHLISRRSLMLRGAAVGAGTIGASRLLADPSLAVAHGHHSAHGGLTKGDVAILQFLAAAELLESDLWQQYNELAGIQDSEVPGGSGSPAYAAAVAGLDEDLAPDIPHKTDDEVSPPPLLHAPPGGAPPGPHETGQD